MKALRIFAVNLVFMLVVVHGSKAEEPVMDNEGNLILSIERQWLESKLGFFSRVAKVMQDQADNAIKTEEFFFTQLALARSALVKSFSGIEREHNRTSGVRKPQRNIARIIATSDLDKMRSLTSWRELRLGYARFLMMQRASWISLRDETLDGEPIMIDSTIPLSFADNKEEKERYERERQERFEKNLSVSLQMDLKRSLEEVGPLIDQFMISAFSKEPKESQILEALLKIGLYTSEERAKIISAVD